MKMKNEWGYRLTAKNNRGQQYLVYTIYLLFKSNKAQSLKGSVREKIKGVIGLRRKTIFDLSLIHI